MEQNADCPAPQGRILLERNCELSAVERSLALLCSGLDAAAQDPGAAGSGGLLAFTGTAGSGKTALLDETRARAVARGCTVLRARGGEQEQESAFHLVRQLFRPLLAEDVAHGAGCGNGGNGGNGGNRGGGGGDADDLSNRADGSHASGRPEDGHGIGRPLGPDEPHGSDAPEGRQGAERPERAGSWYELIAPAVGLAAPRQGRTPDPQGVRDGLDQLLARSAARHAPLVVLLDDIHWADPASLAWLTGFVPRTAALPLLIVAAYEPEELPVGAAGFRRAVERAGCGIHELAPLSPHAVADLVRESFGADADTQFCAECWAVTGGSPFVLTELAARAHDSGLKPQQDNVPRLRELAHAVEGDGFLDRLQGLGPSCVRLAWAVAVLGTSATLRLTASVAALGTEEARHAADTLRAARVLHAPAPAPGPGPDPDAGLGADATSGTASGLGADPGCGSGSGARGPREGSELLEFSHPLLATTVYRAIPDSLRTALHGQAAASVTAAGRGPTASARHLLEIHPDGDPAVVEELREAAREHLGVGAHEAARRCLGRALREPPSPDERPGILYELGCSALPNAPEATVNHLRAALAEPALDARLRVLVVHHLARALGRTGRMDEAARTVEREAHRVTDTGPRQRIQAELFLWNAGRADEEDGHARSRRLARLTAHLTGRGTAERYLLGLRAWDAVVRGEPTATALAHAQEALGGEGQWAGAELPWTAEEWGFEVPVLVALTFLYCDRPGRAEELFARGIAACEREGLRGGHLALGFALLGLVRYRRGRLTDAEELVRKGLEIAERAGERTHAPWCAPGLLIEILLARGEVDEAARTAERYAYDGPPDGMCGGPLDAAVHPDPRAVYAELLLARGLREEAEPRLTAVGRRLEARHMRNPAWCPWQLDLTEALAHTEPARAARTADEAIERARRFGAPSALGRALHTGALVGVGAARLERLREAIGHLERAPAAYELASALVDLGVEARGAGLSEEAADSLSRGAEVAARCGATGLALRARVELAEAGLPPGALR